MKRAILFTFLFILMFNLQAQVDYYTLTRSGLSSYPMPGSSATTLWTSGDEQEQTGVPIGFDFYYGGKKFTTCTVGVNGAISFTENNISLINDLASTSNGRKNMIAPLWDDLILYSANNGYIAYETVGTAPNRVFIVHWKNISRYNDSAHDMSFGLKLRETSNEIEFFYGHCDSGNNLNASIGFNYYDGTNTTFISVTSSGSNPTISRTTANNNIDAANWPGNGYRYTFTFDKAWNDFNTHPRTITLADPRDNSTIQMNYFNNIGATNSPGNPGCTGYQGGDVWYKFTAPSTGAISIMRTGYGIGIVGYAIYHNAYNGTLVVCGGIMNNNANLFIPHMVGDLNAGDTYYIRMWDYYNDDFGIMPFYLAKIEGNDEAAYAIDINVQPENASLFILTSADNTFSTSSHPINSIPSCGGSGPNANYQGGDVWYKFTAPSSGVVKVHHSNDAGDWSAFSFAIYNSATANSDIYCGSINILGFSSPYEVKTVSGLTAGHDYWLRTWDYKNDNIGTSLFYLTDDALSVEDYQQLSFKFYPNPATDVLNVSADSNIDFISITNLLGQEVRYLAPDQKQVILNIADLQNGVYMMRVKAGEKISTVKFIKE